jgi:MFS family permease
LPNIVPPEDLGTANVLMGSTWGTMLTAGAAIGGAVTTLFGRDTSFVVDAVSFAVSALLLARMRGRFSEERDIHYEHPPFLESIRETFRFAKAQPRVLGLLTVKGGYGLGGGVVAMLSVFGKDASVDWSIIGDRKELDVRGAHLGPYCYPIAIDLLSRGLVTSKGIVTHDYTLEAWDEAIVMANSLDSIKVLLKPSR